MNGSPEAPGSTKARIREDRASRDRALFDRIASSYARKDFYEPSRIARITRLARTMEACGLGEDADVLEIGCGAGFSALYLGERIGAYTGIDYSESLIRYASQLDAGPRAHFHAADLYDWQPTQRYDAVFAIGVLHHLPDIPRAMAHIRDMLKPGGILVVNEPQPANPLFHALRKLRAAFDSSYSSEQEELAGSALIGYFEGAGFEDVDARGQGLLSTPFAEVMLGPEVLARPLSAASCRIDAWLEEHMQPVLKRLAWNVVVFGRRAPDRNAAPHDTPAVVD